MKPSDVIRAVCAELEVDRAELEGRTRQQYAVDARHIAWWLLAQLFGMPAIEIQRRFGLSSGTVFHGLRRVEDGKERSLHFKLRQVEARLKTEERGAA
jgi:chromosomal replication initiation ATPase DnaA